MGAGGPLARRPPVCLGGAWRPRGWVFATAVVAFSAPSPVGRLGVRRLVGRVQRGLGSCAGRQLAGFSPAMAAQERRLKAFMYERLYYHPEQVAAAERARDVVARLFAAYAHRTTR